MVKQTDEERCADARKYLRIHSAFVAGDLAELHAALGDRDGFPNTREGLDFGVPLVHVSGSAGNEVYYAERSTQIPSLFTYDHQLWLQFRNGKLTGWKNDGKRAGPW